MCGPLDGCLFHDGGAGGAVQRAQGCVKWPGRGDRQSVSASSCCRDYSTLPYATANAGDDKWLPIDENSPVFNFSEGKSYFAAFKLPQNSGDLRITVAAEIGKTLFFPSVVLMDSQFKVTRVIDRSVFTYKEAQLLAGNRIEDLYRRSHLCRQSE